MADPYENLRKVDLFRDLPVDDLAALFRASSEVTLADGETLFAQGDQGDAAYVITDGAIEIVKEGSEKDTLLAVREPGEVIGEMALLQDEPRMATARGRDATTVLKVPKQAMTHLLDVSPTAVRGLFDIVLDRLRSTQALMKQNERMVQLGTLTAGVAHELNNPAGAVQRAAAQLDGAIDDYAGATIKAARTLDGKVLAEVERLVRQPADSVPLSALERSDLEQELEDALDDAGVSEPWTVAAELIEAGIRPDDLEALDATDLPVALHAVGAGRAVASLARSVSESAERLSSIVGALKSYSFLDQAPVQDVDVTTGIEDTLLILGQKLNGIVVEREFADDLHRIEARGSELNQVWTNLLDNAADAIWQRREREGDEAAGRILIRAWNEDPGVVVEITDDGSGIPDEVVNQIFDSFFTTKEPGKGTGLGLDISYRVVVIGHRGDLTVESEPGRTTFRVELPANGDRGPSTSSTYPAPEETA
jgi:signal transduction histidine kinase